MTPETFVSRVIDEKLILTEQGPLALAFLESCLRRLDENGIVRREAVGLSCENGPECISMYLALAMRGVVVVPLAPTTPLAERVRIWNRLRCRRAVVGSEWMSLESGGQTPMLWPDNIHLILHSSGSTGQPKSIPVAWDAITRNARDVAAVLDAPSEALHFGTMSHCNSSGLYNAFLLPLLTGGRAFVGPMASVFNLRRFLSDCRSFRPQVLWLNPVIIKLLMRSGAAEDFCGLSAAISCTAPLSEGDCLAAEVFFRTNVLQSYGLTETLIVTLERPGREAAGEFSVGIPISGRDSVSIDDGAGNLIIENGAVTAGYADVIEDGVMFSLPDGIPSRRFVTADIGRFDEAGRLHITGRLSNMINVEGVKISAEQIEAVVGACEGVAEVMARSAPDPIGGERPVLFVRADRILDVQDLAALCARKLGPRARPREIFFVDLLPRTPNGKLDRTVSLEDLQASARKSF